MFKRPKTKTNSSILGVELKMLSGQFSTVVFKLITLLHSKPNLKFSRSFYGFGNFTIDRLQRGRPGLKEAESLSQFVTRTVLGATVSERPKFKIPNFAWFLIRISKKSYADRYLVLCIVQIHRLVMFPPEFDVESILSKFTGKLLGIFRDFRNILKSARLLSRGHEMRPLAPFKLKWRTSLRSGPNGRPSIAFAKEDLQALHDDRYSMLFAWAFIKLFPVENWEEVNSQHDQMSESISEIGIIRSKNRPLCTNRLAFLSDKKGKTRVVGIGNSITQSLFKPVHDYLFKVLKTIKCDGTHDHEGQADRVREATKSNKLCHSIDMTACTDRFPALFQAVSLYTLGILTPLQCVVWLLVVCWSRYTYRDDKGNKRSLRYRVGQPMGHLSSWATMAMSHHHLVYWAVVRAYPNFKGKFDSYAIIGDDVVIWDTPVATEYYHILSLLGIEYNSLKSYRETGLAEFAKGYYKNGDNLKPISPHLLLWSKLEGLGKLIGLIKELRLKSFNLSEDRFRKIFPSSDIDFSTALALLNEDDWIFTSPYLGGEDLSFRFGIIRLNLGLKRLEASEALIHSLTSEWVVKNTSIYGSRNWTSPYITVGMQNTKLMPPVRFPSNNKDEVRSTEILMGLDFIAWDPYCWPVGISTVLDRVLACGLSYSDLESILRPEPFKSKYRTSKSYKGLRLIDPVMKLIIGKHYNKLFPAHIRFSPNNKAALEDKQL